MNFKTDETRLRSSEYYWVYCSSQRLQHGWIQLHPPRRAMITRLQYLSIHVGIDQNFGVNVWMRTLGDTFLVKIDQLIDRRMIHTVEIAAFVAERTAAAAEIVLAAAFEADRIVVAETVIVGSWLYQQTARHLGTFGPGACPSELAASLVASPSDPVASPSDLAVQPPGPVELIPVVEIARCAEV